MTKREVILRLTHTEAKWIESALAAKLSEHEDSGRYGEEMGIPAYVELSRLAADNMRDLIAHVNAAAHRAACRH